MSSALDLRALAALWIGSRTARGEIKPNSARTENDRLRLFVTMNADIQPHQLNRWQLLEWQARIGHLRPTTIRARVGTVSRFLRWLHEEGLCPDDLSAHLVRIREPRRAPRGLPHRDIARAIAHCPQPHPRFRTAVWLQPAAVLMVGLGLRCCEISALDLDDYDQDARTLFVRGKGGTEATLPVPAAVAVALDRYIDEHRGWEPGPLFMAVGSKRSDSGRLSAKWVSKRVGKLMRQAGVHREAWDGKTAHALRHTAAHDVLEATSDVTLVQELLRHASLATTQLYLPRARLAKLREAVEGRDYLEAIALFGRRRPDVIIDLRTRKPAVPRDPARGRGAECAITATPRPHAGGNDGVPIGAPSRSPQHDCEHTPGPA